MSHAIVDPSPRRRRGRWGVLAIFAPLTLLALAQPVRGRRARCAADAVAVGPTCVDKYEASVWRIPAENVALITKAQYGRVTRDELLAGGATQLGAFPQPTQGCPLAENTYGPGFPVTGAWTERLYAVSIPGVLPSTCITWFQAEQACRLSDKRLLTNQEWQAAAAGTPDPGDADDGTTTCNTNAEALIPPGTPDPKYAIPTGSRARCVSSWGAHDMVGNVWEWIGNWSDLATACTTWGNAYGDDISCVGTNTPEQSPPAAGGAAAGSMAPPGEGGAADVPLNPSLPSAIIRGGNMAAGARNGVFAFFAGAHPTNVSRSTGFRCAR